ncbi:O-antigen ligase domain-containing protein [bacterium]|nr:O-antigen ligase domain-containing protein [bacterium]
MSIALNLDKLDRMQIKKIEFWLVPLLTVSVFGAFLGPYISVTVLVVGVALTLVLGMLFQVSGSSLISWHQIPAFWPILFLITAIGFSIALAPPYPSAKSIEKCGYLLCFLPFTSLFYKNPDLKTKVVRIAAPLALSLGLLASAQFLGWLEGAPAFFNKHLKPAPHAPGYYIATGLTFHHTPFAATVLWLFQVLLAQRILNPQAQSKGWITSAVMACGVAILTTFSRGVWLATLLSTVLALSLINWRKAASGILVFSVLIGLLFVISPPFQRRLHSYQLSHNPDRLAVWNIAIHMFRDSPWTGQGYHSFGSRLAEFAPDHAKDPGFPKEAHNMYLDFLATTGILGSLAFLNLLFAWTRILIRGYRLRSLNPSDRALIVASIGGFSGFLVAGCFDRHFYMTQTLTPLLFFLSLATSIVLRSERALQEAPKRL